MSTTKHYEPSLAEQATLALLKSQALGQIKFYGLPIENVKNLDFHELCEILNEYKQKQPDTSKTLIEAHPKVSEYPLLGTFQRMRLRLIESGVFDRYENSLLAKATKFKIPFSAKSPDFHKIEDDVLEYEELLDQATSLQIAWDLDYYDPIGLRQEIEYAK